MGLLYVLINCDICLLSMLLFSIEILVAMVMIIFTPEHSVFLFNMACFLGGSGVGGLSVMLPLFIIQDFGKKYFGFVWGLYLFGKELGVWIFTMVVFDHFYGNYNKDRWGRCTKTE
mgnify:CR=1 FL=1